MPLGPCAGVDRLESSLLAPNVRRRSTEGRQFTTDPLGEYAFSSPIAPLTPDVQIWSAAVQALVLTPAGPLEVSTPTIITVVDDAS